jgi:flagellar hook assembly protein FlgD
VAAIEHGTKPAGRHVARWNGRNDAGVRAAPGVYFLRAHVGGREERSRVIVVR